MGHEQGTDEGMAAPRQENAGGEVGDVEDEGIPDAAEPEHTDVVGGTDEIAQTIYQPQQGAFAVGEINVGREAFHPCLAAHEEPCRIVSAIQVVGVAVGGDDEQQHYGECGRYEEHCLVDMLKRWMRHHDVLVVVYSLWLYELLQVSYSAVIPTVPICSLWSLHGVSAIW